MNALTIEVRGDSGSFYSIDLSKEQNRFYARCSCSAGMFGKHCKHVMDIIAGDFKRIESKEELEQVKAFMASIAEFPKLAEVAARIAEIEKQVKALNKKKSAAKAEIDAFIKNGFEFSE